MPFFLKKGRDIVPKRKKYPKLPNGFGSIKYLGKNRTNPYAVHPPTEEFNLNGSPITPKAIAYVDDWYLGFSILMSLKAGTWDPQQLPGMKQQMGDTPAQSDLTTKLLADYNLVKRAYAGENQAASPTFREVYEGFYKYKYEDDKSRVYSKSASDSTRAAYRNCATLHDRVFKDLRHDDLQDVVNACTLKHASLELIVSLYHQMYAYADIREIVDKDYSAHVKINIPDDDESGVPFTEEDLKKLWAKKADPVVEFILIMCYSGYRIRAYQKMEINLEENYFKGGVKTTAGKSRIVPIHPAIRPLVMSRLKRDGRLLDNIQGFRKEMYSKLESLGIEKHTPHDCRHTFSVFCEKYRINENDRKRMLGHSFKDDITNSIYGHRTVDELRGEIEKIKVCY